MEYKKSILYGASLGSQAPDTTPAFPIPVRVTGNGSMQVSIQSMANGLFPENEEGTFFDGEYTSSQTSNFRYNDYHRGIILTADLLEIPLGTTLTFGIESQNRAANRYYPVITSPVYTDTDTGSLVVLRLYPGLETGPETVNGLLPYGYRAFLNITGAGPVIIGVDYSLAL